MTGVDDVSNVAKIVAWNGQKYKKNSNKQKCYILSLIRTLSDYFFNSLIV